MSYASPLGHHSMVFDDSRNNLYSTAILAAVNEDSVVMDLGAGLGLHGFVAATAGAKKVYLVEPAPVINVAAMVAKDNGLSEKVECIQEKVETLQLSQKVDVIISVFTGNFLLQEDLLPSLFLARDNHLAKGGQLIPDQARMFVQPISSEKIFKKNIGRWSNASQGIEFSVLQKYASNSVVNDDFRNSDYLPLAQPTEILHMDFMTAKEASCDTRVSIEVLETGLCHGFLGWFDIRLGDQWLSTSPSADRTHWRQAYLPLNPPMSVNKGQQLTFSLKRPQFGEWSWIVECDGKRQKHSTFLSMPFQPSDLIKRAESYSPVLNVKGSVVQSVLGMFDGRLTAREIKKEVITNQTEPVHGVNEFEELIAHLVDRYG